MLLNRPPGPVPLAITYSQAEACRPGKLRRLWWLIRSLWT